MTRNPYCQMPFLICFGVLVTAAGGMNAALKIAEVQLKKYPIPLRKPLNQMDRNQLGPYQVKAESRISNPDTLASLGTKDYINWTIEDSEAEANSPVRYCNLFITYYTGDPDRVPHVPEECYVGGGNTREDEQVHRLHLNPTVLTQTSTQLRNIDVRRLIFSKSNARSWEIDRRFSVLYFFKVNGEFTDSRIGTRAVMSKNFRCKYSYFSKVEWSFFGSGSPPTVDDIVAASEKLMAWIVPILETQHWPDWEQAKQEK